jgi:CheY-like chemotaxis protein
MDKRKDRGPFNVLLVEDNEADILMLEEVLEDMGISLNLHKVRNGDEAEQYLYREHPYRDAPRPDLVLLDMNLPRKNGFELLAEIKEDDNLKSIPVVILSTSSADMDIDRGYRLHANCFITKPGNLEQFIDVIGKTLSFWLDIARLPSDGNEYAWKE